MNASEIFGAGLCVGIVGLIGYGVSKSQENRRLADTIGRKVDELSKNIDLDISDAVVNEAVKRAVDRELKNLTSRIGEDTKKQFKHDLYTQVKAEVDKATTDIRGKVADEIGKQVSYLSVEKLKEQAVEKASERLSEKLEDTADKLSDKYEEKLEGILDKYTDQLDSVTDIYSAISGRLNRKDGDRNARFRISLD